MSFANPRRAVGAPGNFAGQGHLGFAVGDPEFLASEESQVAAYWRGLEYGSEKFVGRKITGLWGNLGGPRGGLINGAPLDFFFAGNGEQKLVPFVRPQEEIEIGAQRALGYMLGTGRLSRAKYQSYLDALHQGELASHVIGVIEKPIVAQDAYREAFIAFDPGQREKEAVIQVLRDTGFTKGGFVAGRNGTVLGGQTKVRFADVRFRRRAPVTGRQFVSRTGFITGGATSGYTASLVNFDSTFRAQLTDINRVLAEGLARQVAEIQEQKIKRRTVSTGRLVAATLSPQNRFPS